MKVARPKITNADYIPIYYESSKTERAITRKWGNDGRLFFLMLMRALANADYHYIDCSDIDNQEDLFDYCGIEESLGLEILEFLSERKKIDTELWSQKKIIFYPEVIKPLEPLYQKRQGILPDRETVMEISDKERRMTKKNFESKQYFTNPNKEIIENTDDEILITALKKKGYSISVSGTKTIVSGEKTIVSDTETLVSGTETTRKYSGNPSFGYVSGEFPGPKSTVKISKDKEEEVSHDYLENINTVSQSKSTKLLETKKVDVDLRESKNDSETNDGRTDGLFFEKINWDEKKDLEALTRQLEAKTPTIHYDDISAQLRMEIAEFCLQNERKKKRIPRPLVYKNTILENAKNEGTMTDKLLTALHFRIHQLTQTESANKLEKELQENLKKEKELEAINARFAQLSDINKQKIRLKAQKLITSQAIMNGLGLQQADSFAKLSWKTKLPELIREMEAAA